MREREGVTDTDRFEKKGENTRKREDASHSFLKIYRLNRSVSHV